MIAPCEFCREMWDYPSQVHNCKRTFRPGDKVTVVLNKQGAWAFNGNMLGYLMGCTIEDHEPAEQSRDLLGSAHVALKYCAESSATNDLKSSVKYLGQSISRIIDYLEQASK